MASDLHSDCSVVSDLLSEWMELSSALTTCLTTRRGPASCLTMRRWPAESPYHHKDSCVIEFKSRLNLYIEASLTLSKPRNKTIIYSLKI